MSTSSDTIEPESIDLATLATLAGDLSSEYLLQRTRERGHPFVRSAHGYLIQHLVTGTPTVTELASRMGVTQQAASKSVVELETLGIVQREGQDGDQRVRRVTLTDAGREVVESGRAARAQLEAKLVEALGDDSLAVAKKALAALIDAVGGIDDLRGRRVRARTV